MFEFSWEDLMKKTHVKQQIVQENPELVLGESGDFLIDKGLVDKYEIIDVHCHLFKGLAQLFPALLQRNRLKSPWTA